MVLGKTKPCLRNYSIIVLGVALASYGEVEFVWIGVFYQAGGIFAEAFRLIMIQILLSDEGQRLDPLVSLYYYAPVCALMNAVVAFVTEVGVVGGFEMEDFWNVGPMIFFANASVAFALNVASVFLVCALLCSPGMKVGLLMSGR